MVPPWEWQKETSDSKPIWEWKMQGSLYLWRFDRNGRNFDGWHLHVDDAASASIADLIDRMLASEKLCRKVIDVVPERPLPVDPDLPWYAASQLVLIYAREEVEANYWLAELKSDKLHLTLGTDKMQELKAGVVGVPLGKDDYAIGPDVNHAKMTGKERWKHECIWFWSRNPVNQHPEAKTK